LGKIGKPPAHHAMRRSDRACLDNPGQTSTLLVVQDRCAPGRFAGCQTIGSIRVEAKHPVAHDLQRDPGKLRRVGPAASRAYPKASRRRTATHPSIDRCHKPDTQIHKERLTHPCWTPSPTQILNQNSRQRGIPQRFKTVEYRSRGFTDEDRKDHAER